MSLPSADGPLGAASRAAAADPADDGITTVTVTVLDDPRGGATRVSRKRDDTPLADDDDASLCHRLFSSDGSAFPRDDDDDRVHRDGPSGDLPHGDDVWNAVLTAFEAHCLRGGDTAGDGGAAADPPTRLESEETPGLARAEIPADGGAFPEAGGAIDLIDLAFPRAEALGFGLSDSLVDANVSPLAGAMDDLDALAPFSSRPASGAADAADAPFARAPGAPTALGEPSREPSSEPLGASSAAVAELVRANAARALRTLLFGRDDGRGRRRRAVEGPRVSRRRRKKPKTSTLNSRLDVDDPERAGDVDGVETSSDGDRDEAAGPDDAEKRAGAHYARRDPARWRDAATTASSVAALAERAATVSRASRADPRFARTVASLRAAFAVELERLEAVERGLVAGEGGVLARWPGLRAPPAEPPPAGSGSTTTSEGGARVASSDATARVAREATRAMRRSAAARFRECRFRILETFERDVEALVDAARARASPGVASEKRQAAETPPVLETTRAPERVSRRAGPNAPAKGKSRHSARARGVLETWLAEHFYPTATRRKPVPTREEKRRLALETGLTERQVGDWFVNARARIWKPEMQALLRETCER